MFGWKFWQLNIEIMKPFLFCMFFMNAFPLAAIDNFSLKQDDVLISTTGVVGSFCVEKHEPVFYILTQNYLLILNSEPPDTIFGRVISFEGILDKNTGDLQLNFWRIQQTQNFRIKQQGTYIVPVNAKRFEPYLVILGYCSNKSVQFSISDAEIKMPSMTTACLFEARYKILTKTKKSPFNEDIENIMQMDRTDTNSVSLIICKCHSF